MISNVLTPNINCVSPFNSAWKTAGGTSTFVGASRRLYLHGLPVNALIRCKPHILEITMVIRGEGKMGPRGVEAKRTCKFLSGKIVKVDETMAMELLRQGFTHTGVTKDAMEFKAKIVISP